MAAFSFPKRAELPTTFQLAVKGVHYRIMETPQGGNTQDG
jgi:hypothetical protein